MLLVVADQEMYKNKAEREQQRKFPSEVIRFEKGADKSS